MRGEQNLGPRERGRPGVLDDVVVVANQNADAAAMRRVEDGVLVARGHVPTDEAVQLAMPSDLAIRHCDDVGVVKRAHRIDLDQPRPDGDAVFAGEFAEESAGRPVVNRLGQIEQFIPRKVPQMPVAADATFRKGDDLRLLGRGLLGEQADLRQVRRLVAWGVLHLNGGDADVLHEQLSDDCNGLFNGNPQAVTYAVAFGLPLNDDRRLRLSPKPSPQPSP